MRRLLCVAPLHKWLPDARIRHCAVHDEATISKRGDFLVVVFPCLSFNDRDKSEGGLGINLFTVAATARRAMTKYYEIVPGKSIGPLELGMTKEQIEELGISPRRDFEDGSGAYYPLVDIDEETLRKAHYPRPGVNVHYDASGVCHRIDAIFAYDLSPPVFTLYGHVVNGLTDRQIASILQSIVSDVEFSYASVKSTSAGLLATKWEASDDHIMAIQIMPR